MSDIQPGELKTLLAKMNKNLEQRGLLYDDAAKRSLVHDMGAVGFRHVQWRVEWTGRKRDEPDAERLKFEKTINRILKKRHLEPCTQTEIELLWIRANEFTPTNNQIARRRREAAATARMVITAPESTPGFILVFLANQAEGLADLSGVPQAKYRRGDYPYALKVFAISLLNMLKSRDAKHPHEATLSICRNLWPDNVPPIKPLLWRQALNRWESTNKIK